MSYWPPLQGLHTLQAAPASHRCSAPHLPPASDLRCHTLPLRRHPFPLQGRALFADKVTSGPVALPGGGVRQLRKVDTTYIFPGEPLSSSLALKEATVG